MKADKAQITRLLKTARGQLDGLLKMVEEDRYCIDISNQLLATQAILRKANKQVIHAHIKSCVKDTFEQGSPENEEEKIQELLDVMDKLAR